MPHPNHQFNLRGKESTHNHREFSPIGRDGKDCPEPKKNGDRRRGDVAQLVERQLCKLDVRSSNLLISTSFGGNVAKRLCDVSLVEVG